MWQKRIAAVCIGLSTLLILDSVNFGHSLMLFLLTGAITGTSYVLSATQMLSLYALLIGIIVGRMTAQAALYAYARKHTYKLFQRRNTLSP